MIRSEARVFADTMPGRTFPVPPLRSRRQHGAASLFVALALLLGGTVITFFANRSFIFEQRTSVNQFRSTKAFELAEAGAEWAIGRLNENLPLAAAPSCAAGGPASNATFRVRYAAPTAAVAPATAGSLVANTAAAPGCRIDAAGVTNCDCPTAATASLSAPAADEQGRFAVRFASVAPDTVEIVSRGCVNVVGDVACDPSSTAVQSDATATVRMLVKVVPAIAAGPAAALTTGSATVTGGNMHVVNMDPLSNGVTIHAGSTVNLGGSTNVYTLPGTAPLTSIRDNDPALADLTNSDPTGDRFFANYFGQSLSNYRTADPDVIRLGPTAPVVENRCSDCANRIEEILATGVRNPRFYVDGDVAFNGGAIGSSSNPVVLVVNGDIELRGNVTAYGLFYVAGATALENWAWSGSGAATVYGAFISRGRFDNASGNMRLVYDPSLWSVAGAPVGRLVRVPGSWRDF
jgi:hypothetical protein